MCTCILQKFDSVMVYKNILFSLDVEILLVQSRSDSNIGMTIYVTHDESQPYIYNLSYSLYQFIDDANKVHVHKLMSFNENS